MQRRTYIAVALAMLFLLAPVTSVPLPGHHSAAMEQESPAQSPSTSTKKKSNPPPMDETTKVSSTLKIYVHMHGFIITGLSCHTTALGPSCQDCMQKGGVSEQALGCFLLVFGNISLFGFNYCLCANTK